MELSSRYEELQSGVPDIQNLVEHLRKALKDKSSDLFHGLKGRVFHLVGANNKIFQYKVDLEGRITLVRRFKGLNPQEGVEALFKDVPARAQRKFRAAITGDPNKRIRDHLKETPQVKMLDKISFTLGVLIICLTQWVIHRVPWIFPYYFSGLLSFLFVTRYISYKKEKYQYFLLDFCYFVNISTIIQALFFPTSDTWFKINYVLSHGPILTAIVVWQNSLVFHSMDKVTSFFLHAFAPVHCHLTRWSLIHSSFPPAPSSLNFFTGFIYPLLTYFLWQMIYIFLIEVSPISKALAQDTELMTSYRYLTRDKKNSMAQLVRSICSKWNMEIPTCKDGSVDPDTFKMKAIYFAAQFIYSLFTLFYVWIIYSSYGLSCAYILCIFIWGTWNGASYYIEVFSKRYNLKFEVKRPEQNSQDSDDSDDEDFEEATEMIIDDIDLGALHEDKNVKILNVIHSPRLSFVISNDDSKNYSVQELRTLYPQLLIDYLLGVTEGIGTETTNEDKKDV